MQQLAFRPKSGLGDKLFDLVGYIVYCDLAKQQPLLEWCKKVEIEPWGIAQFDERLFEFNIPSTNELPEDSTLIVSKSTCVSFSIPKMIHFLKTTANVHVSFKELIDKYTLVCRKHIRPSHIITNRIPKSIEKCIGIHLRKSDKIKVNYDPRHEMGIREYNEIIANLKSHIETLIASTQSSELHFFVCSEEKAYREEFIEYLQTICSKNQKTCVIVEPKVTKLETNTYINIAAVLDMFCLSRCKYILQGVKYSTFSMMASWIGNIALHNFAKHDSTSLIHVWKPCLSFVQHDVDEQLSYKVANTFANPFITQPKETSPETTSNVQIINPLRRILSDRYLAGRFRFYTQPREF